MVDYYDCPNYLDGTWKLICEDDHEKQCILCGKVFKGYWGMRLQAGGAHYERHKLFEKGIVLPSGKTISPNELKEYQPLSWFNIRASSKWKPIFRGQYMIGFGTGTPGYKNRSVIKDINYTYFSCKKCGERIIDCYFCNRVIFGDRDDPDRVSHKCPYCEQFSCNLCWNSSLGMCKKCGSLYNWLKEKLDSSGITEYPNFTHEWNWNRQQQPPIVDKMIRAGILGSVEIEGWTIYTRNYREEQKMKLAKAQSQQQSQQVIIQQFGSESMKHCIHCGKMIKGAAKFCDECGGRQ